MRLILASSNPAKIEELCIILHAVVAEPLEIIPASNVLGSWYVEESGSTLEENAYLKASAVFEQTLLPTIADDTGLEVDALGGQPGVRTARFAGDEATAEENNQLLLEKLSGVTNRRAQFRTVICYRDRLRTILTEGVCTGTIADVMRGTCGFGYDPLFLPDGHTRTFAEMEPHEKHQLSHRRRGLERLALQLAELWV
ncbi:MAG: RdgB/HAM1 family non-canonical purine NTP pyrophosphatase [Chlorobi bacterium]|nr:RdgB/HAM1 family non-canonical purine NTP pyrophosphatase [Chlorobiota bacterium]